MSPTPPLSKFLKQQQVSPSPSGDQKKTRITQETIEQVREDGRIVVRGYVLTTTGIKIDLKVGQVISVAWNKDGVPQVAFGHNWRRAEFPEAPEELVALGILEIVAPATFSPPAPEPGFNGFVIFTQSGQFILDLGFAVQSFFDASWGENPNTILLKYTLPGDNFQTLAVFKINRTLESTDMPLRRDSNEVVQTISSVPIVDGAIIGTPVREKDDDLPLGRTVTGKENLVIKEEMSGAMRETSDPDCPGPVCGQGGLEGILSFFFEKLDDQLFTFEQSFPMLVGSAEDNPGAYNSRLLHSFVNKSNEIIQIYRITWNIGRILGLTDQEEQFKLFAISISEGPFETVTEALNRRGFAGGDDLPLFREGNSIVFAPIGVVTHNAAEGFSIGNAFTEPYAFLKVRPATVIPFGSNRNFDVFSFNRATNTIIGASFDNPTLEYDREFVLPHFFGMRRIHLDNFGGGFHFDIVVLSRPGFAVRGIQTFINDGTGLPNLLNPLGPAFLVNEEPPFDEIDPEAAFFQTINNVRFTERSEFAGLRPSLPEVNQETVIVRTAITILSEDETFGGIDIDTFELTPLDEGEPDFETGTSVGTVRPFVNKDAFVFVANQRLEDGPPDRRRTILRWPFTSDPTTTLFEVQDDDVLKQLIAHDAAIYVEWTNFGRRIFVEGVDRGFLPGSEPPAGFEFIKPGRGTEDQIKQSYTNDVDGDRNIYEVTVDPDSGEAIVTRTDVPPDEDIVQDKGEIVISPVRLSFHFASVL